MYLPFHIFVRRVGAREVVRATNDRWTDATEPALTAELEAYVAALERGDPPPEPSEPLSAVIGEVTEAIRDAESFALSHLGSLYPTSRTMTYETAPRSLIKATVTVARFYLHDNRATERVRQDYETAAEWLNTAAKGRISLGPAPEGQEDQRRAGSPLIVDRSQLPSRVFPDGDDRYVDGYR